MKTCIACKYFSFDEGMPYGDYPESAYFRCDCGHFNHDAAWFDKIQADVLSKANDCPDYELSDLAKSKGWTE